MSAGNGAASGQASPESTSHHGRILATTIGVVTACLDHATQAVDRVWQWAGGGGVDQRPNACVTAIGGGGNARRGWLLLPGMKSLPGNGGRLQGSLRSGVFIALAPQHGYGRVPHLVGA